MNYLAHFHLACANDDWIIGALLGEFVKGPLRGEWPLAWEQGMRLHRTIDAFSDQHEARAQFARELPTDCRRYAGIVLDVCCDHLLSLHWSQFHREPLPQFTQRVYTLLQQCSEQQYAEQIPPAALRMAQRLIQYDVLSIYAEWDTVTSSLARIGERLKRPNPLSRIAGELKPYLPHAEHAFLTLYPDLIAQCAAFSSASQISAASQINSARRNS